MRVARRRFFGLAAAPALAKAAPALAAPTVEMVEADIAPVLVSPASVPPMLSIDIEIPSGTLSVAEYMARFVRKQMIDLAHEIDGQLREAMK